MKRKNNSKILCIMFFVLIFIMSACGKKETDIKKINIGYFPNITHAQALVGKDGMYENALSEYDINWLKFNAGSSEIEALLAGEIDLGYIGPGPAINGFIKSNGGLKILAGASEAGAIIVCREDLNIKSIEELEGKKVAIPQIGNTQHIILLRMMEESGLKPASEGGTVEIIPVQNPDLLTLFDKKSVDVAFAPEPWASKLVELCNAKIVLEYDEIWRNGEYPATLLIGRTEFVEEYPETVERFLMVHEELTKSINGDRFYAIKEINSGLEKILGESLPEEILRTSLDRMIFSTEVNKVAIMEMNKFMYEMGLVSEQKDLTEIFKE